MIEGKLGTPKKQRTHEPETRFGEIDELTMPEGLVAVSHALLSWLESEDARVPGMVLDQFKRELAAIKLNTEDRNATE